MGNSTLPITVSLYIIILDISTVTIFKIIPAHIIKNKTSLTFWLFINNAMIDEIIIIPAPIHPTIVGILTSSNIQPAIDVPSTAF